MRNIRILAAVGLILLMLFIVGCNSGHDFDNQLNTVTKPYRFSIAGWEFNTFLEKTKQLFIHKNKSTQTDVAITNQYISLSNQINDLKGQINADNQSELQSRIDILQKQQNDLTGPVEDIIKRQVTQILSEMGIYQPWYKYVKLKSTFPPPDFKLEIPPHLLVISPRDKIDRMKDVLLNENMSLPEITNLETNVDNLNVSSLVVDLGGVGTYPNIVSSDSDFQYIIETCAHEWAHTYLAFTPLGFRYVLNIAGLSHNDDITTMNETVSDIIGKEVGAAVLKKYYPQFQSNSQTVQTNSATTVNQPVFNFNQEMQNIRKQVDKYLAAGEIDTAKQYMQQKQEYLAANGYYIRKLNQAYFAFYGTYTDSLAYENPIGTEIKQLRTKSASLKDFLNTVSSMTSVKNLNSALNRIIG
jgi:hypothetical protein